MRARARGECLRAFPCLTDRVRLQGGLDLDSVFLTVYTKDAGEAAPRGQFPRVRGRARTWFFERE